MGEKEIEVAKEESLESVENNKTDTPKQGVWNKLTESAKKTGSFIATNTKKVVNSIEQKIENAKIAKEKNDAINTAFQMRSKTFTIIYKDAKIKSIKCIYDGASKTLKMKEKLNFQKIAKFQDEKHQDYFIEHIELSPFIFEHVYNDEKLNLSLEVVSYTNKQEEPKMINNSISIENSNISGAVGSNCSADKNTKVGVDFNLLKKG